VYRGVPAGLSSGWDFLVERHAMLAARSFPRPWSVVEIPGGFRVDDASGKRLGYFYSWGDANAVHPLGACPDNRWECLAQDRR
jgi:hypothetical protein